MPEPVLVGDAVTPAGITIIAAFISAIIIATITATIIDLCSAGDASCGTSFTEAPLGEGCHVGVNLAAVCGTEPGARRLSAHSAPL